MLCTRMRLVERRFPAENASVTQSSAINNNSNNNGISHRIGSSMMCSEGVAPPPSMGVVQRPCILRNLNGFMDSNGEFGTPRTLFDRSKKLVAKTKPPLVIVSLDLPHGVKTLAPHNVKRDTKRIPCFREQLKEFKRTQSHYEGPKRNATIIQNQNEENATNNDTLMVRGFDILNTGAGKSTDSDNNSNSDNNTNSNSNDDDDLYGNLYFWNKPSFLNNSDSDDSIPRELQIQLTECCQCMHDMSTVRRDIKYGKLFNDISDEIPDDLLPIIKQHDYEQQKLKQQQQKIQQHNHFHHNHNYHPNNGNMHQDSRYLTINNSGRIEPYQAYKPPYVPYTRLVFKRTPSPRTRQVINVNVTMNLKK